MAKQHPVYRVCAQTVIVIGHIFFFISAIGMLISTIGYFTSADSGLLGWSLTVRKYFIVGFLLGWLFLRKGKSAVNAYDTTSKSDQKQQPL